MRAAWRGEGGDSNGGDGGGGGGAAVRTAKNGEREAGAEVVRGSGDAWRNTEAHSRQARARGQPGALRS